MTSLEPHGIKNEGMSYETFAYAFQQFLLLGCFGKLRSVFIVHDASVKTFIFFSILKNFFFSHLLDKKFICQFPW